MKLAIPGKLVEIAHSNTGRTTDLGENSNIHSDEHNNVQIEPATSSAVAVWDIQVHMLGTEVRKVKNNSIWVWYRISSLGVNWRWRVVIPSTKLVLVALYLLTFKTSGLKYTSQGRWFEFYAGRYSVRRKLKINFRKPLFPKNATRCYTQFSIKKPPQSISHPCRQLAERCLETYYQPDLQAIPRVRQCGCRPCC